MPARVEPPAALDAEVLGALLELVDLGEGLGHLRLLADDADEVVHRLLQLLVERVGVLPALQLERPQRCRGRRVDDVLVDGGPGLPEVRDVGGGAETGAVAEHQQVGQRVAAQPVRAVHPAGHLARGEQPGHAHGRAGVGVDLDAAHHVVTGRADLHRLRGDVDVGQLLELVVHRGQPLHDLGGRTPRRDVEEDAAVRGAAAGLDLGVDRAGDLVTREQLRRPLVVVRVGVPPVPLVLGLRVLPAEHVGHVVEHEPLALGVLQDAAVAADRLGDEDALDRRRPDHPGGVELDELHVDQRRAGPHGQGVAVARCTPRSSTSP